MTAHQLRELYVASAGGGSGGNPQFGGNPGGGGGPHHLSSSRLLDLSPVTPLRYGIRPYDPLQMLQQQGAVNKLLGKGLRPVSCTLSILHHFHVSVCKLIKFSRDVFAESMHGIKSWYCKIFS